MKMAVETSTNTEKQVCSSCGADVRPNTTFCYNCGSSVAEKSFEKTSVETRKSDFLKPDIASAQNGNYVSAEIESKAEEPIIKPIEKPFDEPLEAKNDLSKIEEKILEPKGKPGLKSAASMRRPQKNAQPKNVEVVWEQPENSTSVWFVIFAFILLLFAVGALLAMLYLK